MGLHHSTARIEAAGWDAALVTAGRAQRAWDTGHVCGEHRQSRLVLEECESRSEP